MALPVLRTDRELARWDPWADFERLMRQMDQMMFGSLMPIAERLDTFTPLADIEETDDEFIVELELPGVKKEDIDVELSGRTLTVTGERKEKERTGILRRKHRVTGRFFFEVTLPAEVDDSGVEARLENGVLTLRVPKTAAARRRHIEIR